MFLLFDTMESWSEAFLDSIEISATDAWTLFASLDIDGDKARAGHRRSEKRAHGRVFQPLGVIFHLERSPRARCVQLPSGTFLTVVRGLLGRGNPRSG